MSTADRIRELAAKGLYQAQIARELGINSGRVCEIAEREQILIRRIAPGGRKPRERAIVPKWVPDDLRSEYLDAMRLYGEEAAASRVRALKAEAARC